MKRDTGRLSSETFDVLVIGGGIYGATIACAAAMRGLKVALVEQGDFGQGTSANSLKVIHGGLRYLQHLNLKRMRESIIARRRLLQLAPHLVIPCPFVLPTYGVGMKGRPVMAAALLVNDLLSCDRNRAVHPYRHIPNGHILSRQECLQIMPGIDSHRLTGGAVWYDAVVSDTERLNLSFLLSADERGACVANYIRMNSYLLEGNRVAGVAVSDTLGGHDFDIHAQFVVNTTGARMDPHATDLSGSTAAGGNGGWAKATNIVVNRPLFGDYAVGLAGSQRFVDKDAVINKGNRYFMFVPWRGGTLIGTNYQPYNGRPGECVITKDDIAALLDEVNRIYPVAGLSGKDVSFAHAGLLPMESDATGSRPDVVLTKHEQVVEHDGTVGPLGSISVTGVKYTTSVQVADRVANLLLKRLGRSNTRVHAEQPLYGGDSYGSAGIEPPAQAHTDYASTDACLIQRYGSRYRDITRYAEEAPSLGLPVAEGSTTIAAEVVHAVRCEMAYRLTDVVLRRTGLGTLAYPGQAAIRNCASLMAAELDWSAQQLNDEIRAVEDIYRVYGIAGELAEE